MGRRGKRHKRHKAPEDRPLRIRPASGRKRLRRAYNAFQAIFGRRQ